MTWQEIKFLLNSNQGVLEVILFIASNALSFIFGLKKGTRLNVQDKQQLGSGQVRLFSLFSKVEGGIVGQSFQNIEEEKQAAPSSSREFDCLIDKTTIGEHRGLYYRLSFNTKTFVLEAVILDGVLTGVAPDRTGQLEIGASKIVSIFKEFKLFDDGKNKIFKSKNLLEEIQQELGVSPITLRIQSTISDLLTIPFQIVKGSDVGNDKNNLEISIRQ